VVTLSFWNLFASYCSCCFRLFAFVFVGVFDGSVGFWAYAFWFSCLFGTSVGKSARRPVFFVVALTWFKRRLIIFSICCSWAEIQVLIRSSSAGDSVVMLSSCIAT
jgi:hypothetical protein